MRKIILYLLLVMLGSGLSYVFCGRLKRVPQPPASLWQMPELVPVYKYRVLPGSLPAIRGDITLNWRGTEKGNRTFSFLTAYVYSPEGTCQTITLPGWTFGRTIQSLSEFDGVQIQDLCWLKEKSNYSDVSILIATLSHDGYVEYFQSAPIHIGANFVGAAKQPERK